MDPLVAVVYALVFPGLLFLFAYALFLQFVDRKVTARLQNRVGPPWWQPFADLVKLLSKEDITPENVDHRDARDSAPRVRGRRDRLPVRPRPRAESLRVPGGPHRRAVPPHAPDDPSLPPRVAQPEHIRHDRRGPRGHPAVHLRGSIFLGPPRARNRGGGVVDQRDRRVATREPMVDCVSTDRLPGGPPP